MSFHETIKRYLTIAYLPSKTEFRYASVPEGINTKAIIESVNALLILYAASSELPGKILLVLGLEQSFYAPLILRLIICIGGILVCLHILYATNPGDKIHFIYSRIPRVLAGFMIWLLGLSFSLTIYQIWHQPQTTLGTSQASYDLPMNLCHQLTLDERANKAGKENYLCPIQFPAEYNDKFKHLKISIRPAPDFKLLKVEPQPPAKTVLPRQQEPLEANSGAEYSEWVFQEFSAAVNWQVNIWVQSNKAAGAPNRVPLVGTLYFYN